MPKIKLHGQVQSVKLKLHDQEWRDFQSVPEPKGNPAKFKATLKRSGEKMRQRSVKSLQAGQTQTELQSFHFTRLDPNFLIDDRLVVNIAKIKRRQ
jgi:hypothetical protein